MAKNQTKRDGAYPVTRWALIDRARQWDHTAGRDALGELYRAYRKPLLAHLAWRFRASLEQAEDWLQSFVLQRIHEYRLLDHADQERGRFRTFLLTALDRFVQDELAKERAAKRKPKGGFVDPDTPEATNQPDPQPAGPDPVDVEWAREVLAQAIGRTQRWFESRGKPETWRAFYLGRLRPNLEDEERPSDQAIAKECGLPVGKVANTIGNAVRKFRTELRSVIREYEHTDAKAGEETRLLWETLARAD